MAPSPSSRPAAALQDTTASSRKDGRPVAPPGVVITGGDFQALGVLRTLAGKGVPVVVLDSEACMARFSRYRHRFFRSPRLGEPQTYLDFLEALASRQGLQGWVLLPNSDEAVHLISRHRERLLRTFRVPTPGWQVIENVYVKQRTYELAERHGIPAPRTRVPGSLEKALAVDLPFPLVLKPSIRDHLYSQVRVKAYRVDNRRELEATWRAVSGLIDPAEILVQELIPGGPRNLYSFCPFYKDGRVVAAIMARRARQHPMDFGHASTYAEIVDVPEMRATAEKFLALIGYYGIGEVEFMQDPRDGLYKLIEVNPRVWGWHTLAIAAGVDLVYYLYRDALGEKVEPALPAAGVKWVRLVTDLPTVVLEMARGRMSLADYLASMRGKKTFAEFSLKDPLPGLVELLMIPYLWIRRGF